MIVIAVGFWAVFFFFPPNRAIILVVAEEVVGIGASGSESAVREAEERKRERSISSCLISTLDLIVLSS